VCRTMQPESSSRHRGTVTHECHMHSESEKHYACDSRLHRTTYILLYHDQKPVESLSCGQQPFTLEGYQEGKSYSKLILYICPSEDYDCGLLLSFVLVSCFVE